VHDREVLTTAVGHSMTTVPATTDMHYRIGGIAETFMSTLLLMLVEQGHISLDDKISRWFPSSSPPIRYRCGCSWPTPPATSTM
jgi:CubicO group peptidase (beta-lactamase class C family)